MNYRRVKRRVMSNTRRINALDARYIGKAIEYGQLSCAQAVKQWQTIDTFSYNEWTSILGKLPYYDEATGTYNFMNLLTAPNKSIAIKSVYCSLRFSNNSNLPVWVTCYVIRPRADSSVSGFDRMFNGLVEQSNTMDATYQPITGGAINNTNPHIQPSYSKEFRSAWKIIKKRKFRLGPGGSYKLFHKTGGFTINTSYFQGHTLDYQKALRYFQFMFSIQGAIAHGCNAAVPPVLDGNIGTNEAYVDWKQQIGFEMSYNGGADFVRYAFRNGANGMLNEAVTAVPDSAQIEEFTTCYK